MAPNPKPDDPRSGLTEDDHLLKVSTVARRLDVKPKQVWKWIACGQIPGVRRLPSGQYRIPESSLHRLLQAH